MFSARARRLADYVAATENEIAIDVHFLAQLGLTPAHTGYLPRSPKWVSLAQRHPGRTRLAWRLLWLAWVGGGAIAFFTLELLRMLTARRRAAGAVGGEGAVVAFSSRVGDVINDAQFPGFPRTWLTLPWAMPSVMPDGARLLELLGLLDRGAWLGAYRDALHATWLLLRRRRTRPWILQSYTALRWFAVRAALEHYPRQLVIAEHYDRWAVLADSVARQYRRARGLAASARDGALVLVQHGTLGRPDADRPGLTLRRRLGAVTDLHAYSEAATAHFCAVVLSRAAARRLRTALFAPRITLSGPARSATARLLFVGAPMCELFHRDVFLALRAAAPLVCFYKPHPKAPMAEPLRQLGWEVVAPDCFPAVELLVAYESTLVIEYQNAGIPAVVHPVDAGSGQVAPVVAQILERLVAHQDRARADSGSGVQ